MSKQSARKILTKENCSSAAYKVNKKGFEQAFAVAVMNIKILKEFCLLCPGKDLMHVIKACTILHDIVADVRKYLHDGNTAAVRHGFQFIIGVAL